MKLMENLLPNEKKLNKNRQTMKHMPLLNIEKDCTMMNGQKKEQTKEKNHFINNQGNKNGKFFDEFTKQVLNREKKVFRCVLASL